VQAGSQDDVFFELLSNSTSALHGGGQQKKREAETRVSAPPVVDFGNEESQSSYDVQPSYDFQPSASALTNNNTMTVSASGPSSSSLVLYFYPKTGSSSSTLLKHIVHTLVMRFLMLNLARGFRLNACKVLLMLVYSIIVTYGLLTIRERESSRDLEEEL